MGFGFVVARFGLFLQELEITQHGSAAKSYGFSLWFGTALIAVGVMLNLLSARRHARLIQQLKAGKLGQYRPSRQGIIVAVFLAVVGLAMAIYLILVRSPAPQPGDGGKLMSSDATSGIVRKPSKHSVEQTVENLKTILQAKGVTLFALVDHSGEAEKVGMQMPATKLLIFGNPKAGTPLMLAAPSVAIDLPLKILVWQDAQGKVWLSYNSPAYLQARHGLPPELLPNIAVVEALAAKVGE